MGPIFGLEQTRYVRIFYLRFGCVVQLDVSPRMTDQDKEDFIKRTIDWQQNGLDLDKRNCLVLNFGSALNLNYPQIRKISLYICENGLGFLGG